VTVRRDDGYEPSDFFVLRTPLLAWPELERWGDAGRSDDEAARRPALRRHLAALIARPAVAEALAIAAPALVASLPAWIAAPDGERGRKIERALVRYVERMCGRPTPFGLFAGVSHGRVEARRHLVAPPSAGWQRSTRLDMGYLGRIVRDLVADPAVRVAIPWRTNATLYEVDGVVRWIEIVDDVQRGRRRHQLAGAEANETLAHVVARARGGLTWAELVATVREHLDEPLDDPAIEGYLRALIDGQILVPELEPPVTGGSPIDALCADLARLPVERARQVACVLGRTRVALARCDRDHAIGDAGGYDEVLAVLGELTVAPEGMAALQVDLFKPSASLTLDRALAVEIAAELPALWSLCPSAPSALIADFGERFEARYGTREVPLAVALDPDLGIGLGVGHDDLPAAPLIAELGLRRQRAERSVRAPRREWLQGRIREVLARRTREWSVTDDDLRELDALAPAGGDGLPDGLLVRCSILTAADGGDLRIVIENAAGPSVTRMLGRFAVGDEALCASLRAEAALEQARSPGALLAEIVHVPTDRASNVNIRPRLREYELPLLARSSAPADRQLDIDDLWVRVEAGMVRLRSRRLDRDVAPRMSTAHNLALPTNLPLYRFLGELQSQGVRSSLGWIFDGLAGPPFLPRVRRRRLILSPATWFISGADRRAILDAASPAQAMAAWRAHWDVPRIVSLVEGDQALPTDLDNPLCVDALLQSLATQPVLALAELFPDGLRPAVHGDDGPLAHEVLLPLRRSAPPVATAAPRPLAPATARSFRPGSEWLYAKLYVGEASADAALSECVGPLARTTLAEGLCDRWFFLRFRDPDPHLRVRFRGDPRRLVGDVLPRLAAAVASFGHNRVWRTQIDTYERELERYGGGEVIDAVEELFWRDSEAALAVIDATQATTASEARWLATLAGIDALLDEAGLPAVERASWLEAARQSFELSFETEGRQRTAVGDRFRRARQAIDAICEGRSPPGPLAVARAAFDRRATDGAAAWHHIATVESRGGLAAGRPQLLRSMVHMHVNRMSRTAANAHELVLYDLLLRRYRGLEARAAQRRASSH
jgi:thiopeptide-type bacteriocin biosynthesis protein